MHEELTKLFETRINAFNEQAFFNTLFKCRGVVYGGFLRDLVAHAQPKDIDVVISVLYASEFDAEMAGMGFTASFNEENNTTLWSMNGHLPVESYIVEDSPDDTFIGPESAPDYDVNILRYDGKSFRNWMNGSNDVAAVVDHIKQRIAIEFHEDEVRPERRAKIIFKGYAIIQQ